MSERIGTPVLDFFSSLLISPPTMNGVLSATRTKVWTCRLSISGGEVAETDELTIVSTCMVTSEPSSLTLGRIFSTIPVCRYSTLVEA